MPPRILHASLPRPGTAALLILTGSAATGFGYRHWASSSSSKPGEPPAESPTLDPHRFAHYTIASTRPVSTTSTLFTLRARDASTTDLATTWARCVWSVEAKQPQLQIARAYTPLPPLDGDASAPHSAADELRFLIRRERAGEVSSYLHRLPAGALVELRGPHVGFALPDDDDDDDGGGGVQEVVFLAGGTGIAPAMQVAHALARRESGGARMRILWANRRREECVGGVSDGGVEAAGWRRWVGWGRRGWEVGEKGEKGVMVEELEALKRRGGQLAVEYFVDEEKSFIQPAHVARLLRDGAGETEKGTVKGKKLVLISGPDGFVEYWAGRKVWAEEGEVQGPLRGALAKMDLKGWKVWKL